MDDKEWLNAYKADKKEEYKFFSNEGKSQRERWVAAEFLKQLQIEFETDELSSPKEASKIDVVFKTAQFQIKEICNPGTRRTIYIREAYRDAEQANCIEDLRFPSIGEDIPTTARIYDLVVKMAEENAQDKRYMNIKSELDLLLYVTRTNASLIKTNQIRKTDFSELGWRSVCCLSGNQAIVLFFSDKSPDFLKR